MTSSADSQFDVGKRFSFCESEDGEDSGNLKMGRSWGGESSEGGEWEKEEILAKYRPFHEIFPYLFFGQGQTDRGVVSGRHQLALTCPTGGYVAWFDIST